MSDVDAQGNVDNSNIPPYTPRAKSNATDIRRIIGSAPSVFKIGPVQLGVYQTIADLTGVETCDEGVEIIIHGSTADSQQDIRSCNVYLKLGGVTGVASPGDSDIFHIQRNSFGTLRDPLGEASEGIFIPTDDPTKVSIAGITNVATVGGLHPNPNFNSQGEVRIK